ncbi:putative quinol monooxygenase [Nocardiopsis potens]|uniref:putative quinol monooxygenase n=1 Tax=Nocardiopsis potens TaxID=1246458 RepID=UPI000347F924|nr:hypothetical protein [Nocardiopsis potens]
MVEVALAFVCALVAWSAAAALIARTLREPRTYAKVLSGSAVAVAVALSGAFVGALLDFSAPTFRILQIGAGLLGPLLAAWGTAEYAVGSARARFGLRLAVAVLSVVPVVVLALDPVRGNFDRDYPAMSDHYDLIPGIALGAVHLFSVGLLLACAVAAMRAEGRRTANHRLTVVGLIALAVLLEIAVTRLGLGMLGQVLMAGALGALWTGFLRAQNPPEEPRGRRRGRRRSGAPRSGGDESDEQDREDRDEGDDEVWGRRRKRTEDDHYDDGGGYDDGYDDGYDEAPAPRAPSRLRGVITIYTLAEGGADGFDDCADLVVDEVARREPDTLLFACHTVPSAPLQRIVYAIYRDELALEEHEQQPHVREFSRRSAQFVTATNVIELALSGASATDNLADMLMPR